MKGSRVYLEKKTVQDILKQVEKNEADGHTLGRHLQLET
jgi:hypothetical protein